MNKKLAEMLIYCICQSDFDSNLQDLLIKNVEKLLESEEAFNDTMEAYRKLSLKIDEIKALINRKD